MNKHGWNIEVITSIRRASHRQTTRSEFVRVNFSPVLSLKQESWTEFKMLGRGSSLYLDLRGGFLSCIE